MTTRPGLDQLRDRVLRALGERPASTRYLVGIAGAPGAGKSTLAEALAAALEVQLPGEVASLPMDGFHLADAGLDRLGLRDRKGAPETFDAAGYVALLRRVRAGDDEVVWAPGFERTLEQPIAGAIAVPRSARVVVTEGNYLLLDGAWSPVRGLLDEVWFCVPDDTTRLERLIARHVEFGKAPDAARAWVERLDEANALLVTATRDRADLLVEVG